MKPFELFQKFGTFFQARTVRPEPGLETPTAKAEDTLGMPSVVKMGASGPVPQTAHRSAPGTTSPDTAEIGVSGLHVANGYVYEEFLQELQGDRGRKIYREMTDNDDTIGALLTAVDSMLKASKFRIEKADKDKDGEMADFVESMLDDMEQPFEDFIAEVLTMLPFGFSLFEICYKRRVGLYETDPIKFSKFSDGKIGIRKLAPRSQESLLRWEMDEKNELKGFWQMPPQGAMGNIYIPMGKALLFRTTSKKNNPEGRSILRNAYRSYYFKKNIEIIESIAIERELNGVPVVRIPSIFLTDTKHALLKAAYEQIAKDLKFNEQAGVVIPSDTYVGDNGTPSAIPKVSIELISAKGSRSIDTNAVITRYSQNIARTVLADFLILGSGDKGSFALSKNKTDLFIRSIEGYNNNVAGVLNRNLLPNIWKLNALDPELMPKFVPGRIAPEDIVELADFIEKLSRSGFMFAGDPATEKRVREAADLPTEVAEDEAMLEELAEPWEWDKEQLEIQQEQAAASAKATAQAAKAPAAKKPAAKPKPKAKPKG